MLQSYLVGSKDASPATKKSLSNGRPKNGHVMMYNGHSGGNGSLPYAKHTAERVQSNSTDTTMISDRSTPSDTSSPQRADGDNILPGALHLSMVAANTPTLQSKPPIPGDDMRNAQQRNGTLDTPASQGRVHIYQVVGQSSQDGTPAEERTIAVEVARNSPSPIRLPAPTTAYTEPVDELEVMYKFCSIHLTLHTEGFQAVQWSTSGRDSYTCFTSHPEKLGPCVQAHSRIGKSVHSQPRRIYGWEEISLFHCTPVEILTESVFLILYGVCSKAQAAHLAASSGPAFAIASHRATSEICMHI